MIKGRAFRWVNHLILVLSVALGAGVHRIWGQSAAPAIAGGSATSDAFDSDSNHLWNRLHSALWLRTANGTTYGDQRLDPLLWDSTEYLLNGPEHDQAIAVLDEFIARHGEQLTRDPLRRAILQRELWSVFDWVGAVITPGGESTPRNPRDGAKWTKSQQRDLLVRLSQVIARVALSQNEIQQLGDNYAAAVASKAFAATYDADHPEAAFLPPDLLDANGSWVCLGADIVRARRAGQFAPAHSEAFGQRSVFQVFLRLPDGKQATLNYLAKLGSFPDRYIPGPGGNSTRGLGRNARPQPPPPVFNPEVPQFPAGTQVALVRNSLLVNDQGDLVASPITETVQVRVYRRISSPDDRTQAQIRGQQDFYQFDLDRKSLFAGHAGGLRAIQPSDRDYLFVQFRGMGLDLIELPEGPARQSAALASCFQCHSAPGVRSMESFAQLSAPVGQIPANLIEAKPETAVYQTIAAKRQQYSWGLLSGLLTQGQR